MIDEWLIAWLTSWVMVDGWLIDDGLMRFQCFMVDWKVNDKWLVA